MDFLWTVLGEVLTSPVPREMPTVVAEEIRVLPANPGLADPLFVSPAGLVFKNALQPDAGALNTGTIVQQQVTSETIQRENGTEYVDNCRKGQTAIGTPRTTGTGTSVEYNPVSPYLSGLAEARSWFISRQTPPTPGLRVIVRNASLAQSMEQMPYTDREYSNGSRSEKFVVAIGDQHESKFFAVKSGTNHLIYQIKRDNQVIESGEFNVNIDVQVQNTSKTTRISRPKENLRCVGKEKDEKHKKHEKREKDERKHKH
jgi:hypothetical protein